MDIDIADIVEKMTDAYNEAILNGIEANTIVINEKYAITDRLYYRGSDRVTFEIPPMFIGLKVAFAELPKAFAFMLMNSPIKSKDDIRAEERKKALEEFATTLKERFEKTSTIATALHGRRESEIESIINTVAAEYGVEVEK